MGSHFSENVLYHCMTWWGGAHRPGGSICIFRDSRFAFAFRGGGRSHRRRLLLRFLDVSGRASHDRYQELCKRMSSDEDTAGGSCENFPKSQKLSKFQAWLWYSSCMVTAHPQMCSSTQKSVNHFCVIFLTYPVAPKSYGIRFLATK